MNLVSNDAKEEKIMIKLKKYNEDFQTICDPQEIELKLESMFKQHIIKLNNIIIDGFSLEIQDEILNPHLKAITISFDCANTSSNLVNFINDKNHKIINVKIKYTLANFEKNTKEDCVLELKNLIMSIENIELYGTSNMRGVLKGYMVV